MHTVIRQLAAVQILVIVMTPLVVGCSSGSSVRSQLQGVWEWKRPTHDNDQYGFFIDHLQISGRKAVYIPDGRLSDQMRLNLKIDVSQKPYTWQIINDEVGENELGGMSGEFFLDGKQLRIDMLSENKNERVTWTYEKVSDLPNIDSIDPTFFSGVRTYCYWRALIRAVRTAQTSGFESSRNTILGLTIERVDKSAVQYGADLASYFSAANRTVTAIRQNNSNNQQLNAYLNSDEAFAEFFFDGLLTGATGQSPGFIQNRTRQQQQLAATSSSLASQWQQLEEQMSEIRTRSLTLRADLSREYEREFPPLN